MLKSSWIILSILALLLVLIIIINTPYSLTGLSISSQEANLQQTTKSIDSHAWTKAICTKDNFCQDYLIECQGQEPVKLSPITGASVQFDNNWQDPRPLEQRERLCE